jgi:hypothetical protein
VLRPADGRAYLDALSFTFTGEHFWAMRVYEVDSTPSYEERKGPEQ